LLVHVEEVVNETPSIARGEDGMSIFGKSGGDGGGSRPSPAQVSKLAAQTKGLSSKPSRPAGSAWSTKPSKGPGSKSGKK